MESQFSPLREQELNDGFCSKGALAVAEQNRRDVVLCAGAPDCRSKCVSFQHVAVVVSEISTICCTVNIVNLTRIAKARSHGDSDGARLSRRKMTRSGEQVILFEKYGERNKNNIVVAIGEAPKDRAQRCRVSEYPAPRINDQR